MHRAKAFLLIKFVFCFLLRLASLHHWTPRSTRLTMLSISFFPPPPHPSQASPSIYSNSAIVSALKEWRASFPMGFWDVWSLGAVPKLPLLTCKLLLLHEKFSELQQSAAPFHPASLSFTIGGTTEPWGINMIMLYSFTLKILATGIVAQQHEAVYHCWLH